MNVQSHTATMRDRARLSSTTAAPTGPTADAVDAHASKTDSIRIDSVELPADYYPGETLYPAVSLRSSNLAVSLFDADHCVARNLINGYRCRIIIEVNGRRVAEREVCLASGTGQPYRYDFPNGLAMPRTGDAAGIRVRVRMANTGTVVAERSTTLTAIQSEPDPAPDPTDPTDPTDPGGGGQTTCGPGFVYDYAQDRCVPITDGGTGGGGGSGGDAEPCRGLLDAIFRADCSLDTYLANAQSGGFTVLAGLMLVFFVVLAVSR
jgi:hypothetical protein